MTTLPMAHLIYKASDCISEYHDGNLNMSISNPNAGHRSTRTRRLPIPIDDTLTPKQRLICACMIHSVEGKTQTN